MVAAEKGGGNSVRCVRQTAVDKARCVVIAAVQINNALADTIYEDLSLSTPVAGSKTGHDPDAVKVKADAVAGDAGDDVLSITGAGNVEGAIPTGAGLAVGQTVVANGGVIFFMASENLGGWRRRRCGNGRGDKGVERRFTAIVAHLEHMQTRAQVVERVRDRGRNARANVIVTQKHIVNGNAHFVSVCKIPRLIGHRVTREGEPDRRFAMQHRFAVRASTGVGGGHILPTAAAIDSSVCLLKAPQGQGAAIPRIHII